MLTSLRERADKIWALETGADDFLSNRSIGPSCSRACGPCSV